MKKNNICTYVLEECHKNYLSLTKEIKLMKVNYQLNLLGI